MSVCITRNPRIMNDAQSTPKWLYEAGILGLRKRVREVPHIVRLHKLVCVSSTLSRLLIHSSKEVCHANV